jgi:hypothetical protein
MQPHPITVFLSLRFLLSAKTSRAYMVRELRGQLIRSGLESGGPAAAPSSALVSDCPTSFLTGTRNTTPYMAVL